MKNHLKISGEIASALRAKKPVVALESTIITHGMPHPDNVNTALETEALVRREGAVPASIAVVRGEVLVGLSKDTIEALGTGKLKAAKLSTRDLPQALACGLNGSTTVAATMFCANLAGIKVFATGGIGGVHKGAGETFDISADLTELARTPVAVVCAGAKAILDLGLTLEYLETMGVPVISYRSGDFAAFYTRSSGFRAPVRAENPGEIAAILRAQGELGLGRGTVISNPIPEENQLDPKLIAAAIAQGLAMAKTEGITGKALTPYLLRVLNDLTRGAALSANIALIKNNACLAARIAAELERGTRPAGRAGKRKV